MVGFRFLACEGALARAASQLAPSALNDSSRTSHASHTCAIGCQASISKYLAPSMAYPMAGLDNVGNGYRQHARVESGDLDRSAAQRLVQRKCDLVHKVRATADKACVRERLKHKDDGARAASMCVCGRRFGHCGLRPPACRF